ncbi:protein SRC2-like isoform X1 [Chenopodium quinoa]|uniref:protein SRC2-like isoform X1 n=1 Tax=Chenopodium quinoa TaxID=63459 RepID=UPI000B777D1E|nr:protein SRC2-like isoform X1 [Chenopodium quinoa]
MVYKTLEITLISAKDLKNVNLIGKMDPYVVVHLSDDPKNKQKTPVHQDGGTNPAWNYTIRFTIDDAVAAKPGKYVVFTLKHEHTFGADKDLGEVLVPLKELLDGVKDPSGSQLVTYQVKRVSSQKAQGELKLSYKFVDVNNMGSYGKGEYKPAQSCSSSSGSAAAAAAPYPPPGGYGGGYGDVYPPPHHAGGYPPAHSQAPPPAAGIPYAAAGAPGGYPPQQYPPQQSHGTGVPYSAAPQGYPQYGGYPPPPNAGYGYPPSGGYPPPGGYPAYPPAGGYAQKPQKPKKSGGMGMGLGAGLLGGAIGGLVLGEVMDDAFDVDCDF